MSSALAFVPQDRRQTLVGGQPLADPAIGVVLFADISGFTAMTNAYVAVFGPQRGVEEATRSLNVVYTALIAVLEAWQGTVVGFSGDGMMCWFAAGAEEAVRDALTEPVPRAARAAAALHAALAPLSSLQIDADRQVSLNLKVALAAGRVRRLLVGDPAIQLVDVIGGLPVDLVGLAEQLANPGETVAAASLLPYLRDVQITELRQRDDRRFAVLQLDSPPPDARPVASEPPSSLAATDRVRPWLLPDVANRLATIDEQYWAELRPGVALFVRFTGLDYDRDPDVGERLDTFIQQVQRTIHRLEGALIQVTTGDKGSYLYAAFGATRTHTDDAARGVAAAIEILQDETAWRQVDTLQIGVASGRMRTGAYGSPSRRTFGAQGGAVNLAARLMMAAPAGEVYLTGEVADAVSERFDVEFHADLPLKGMTAPVPVYRVAGVRHGATEHRVARQSLVGREDELARLDKALQCLESGQGEWLELVGPAGIGKSALLHTLASQCAQAGHHAVLVEADALRGPIAYLALHDLLRAALTDVAGLNLAVPLTEEIVAWATQQNPAWLSRLPLLRDVLHLDLQDTPVTARLTPEMRQSALAALVGEILAALAQPRPLVLLIDNAQWLDEASLLILAQVGRGLADSPLLLVTTARADNLPNWGEIGPARVEVGDLSPQAMTMLVSQQLEPAADPLIGRLINRVAQGNPYVAGETLAFLRAGGHVRLRDGTWTLDDGYMATLRAARIVTYGAEGWSLAPDEDRTGALPGVPDSLHGLLLARFDRLADDEKLTLKVASVVGRTVEPSLLEAVHPRDRDGTQLPARLARLVEAGVLGPADGEGVHRLVFRHGLMQEVVYNTLLHRQQQELHGAVARVLEARTPDAVEQLAHHYGAADLAEPSVRGKAIRYLDMAAAKHEREFANETALQLVTRVMHLAPTWSVAVRQIRLFHVLGRRQEEQAALERAARWRLEAGYELPLWQSRYHEQIAEYNDAHRAAQAALAAAARDDIRAQVECLVQQANIAGREGDYAAEAARYLDALSLAEATEFDDHEVIVDLYYGLGIVLRQRGEYEKACDAFEHALELAAEHGLPVAEAKVRTAWGFAALQLRHFETARTQTEASLHLRRTIGDKRGEGDSLSTLAQVLIHGFGDYVQARGMLLEALALQRSIGNRWSMVLNLNELGVLHLMIGQYAAAEPYLYDGLTLCHQIGTTSGLFYIRLNLGIVLREQGKLDEATVHLDAALAAAEALDDPHAESLVRSELAMIALAREQWRQAYRQAALARSMLSELDLQLMSTPDLTTQARAALKMDDSAEAVALTEQAWTILATSDGNGPDFPHRDAFFCAELFAALGRPERAQEALAAAYGWLNERAARISDAALREAYRRDVAVHAAILAAMDSGRLPAAARTSDLPR